MKLALVGYGKMGHEIEKVAREQGHEIVCIIDADNRQDFTSDAFRQAEAAIEFTTPATALSNYRQCFAAHIPVVSGTTGWLEHLPEVREACARGETFFYSSNFSLGVNIFMSLNRYLARIMNRFPDYDVRMEEIHHIHKLDAPSGTAISLAEDIIKNVDRKQKWVNGPETSANELSVISVREGEVPGTHTVTYESDADLIRISHEAKNRRGFAAGAVAAAEFVRGKKGQFLTMQDMLDF